MSNRPAGWRMPTQKQFEKLSAAARKVPGSPPLGAGEPMPPEYWRALLSDARADGGRPAPGTTSGRGQRLNEIPQHLPRVACRRGGRTVEIQKTDAVRLYGPDATWRNVGQSLLDNWCTQRTGRHEEDGCWPLFE